MKSPYSDALDRDMQRLIRSLVKTFQLRPDYSQNVAPGEWTGLILPRSYVPARGRVLQGIEIEEVGLDLVFHIGTRDWPSSLDLMATIDHGFGEWIANCADTELLRNLKRDERPIECAASQLLVDPHTWRLDLTATATANFAVHRKPDGQHILSTTQKNGD
jgi:hypothetical protein